MPIAYYATVADERHWSNFWSGQQLAHLLAVAERDPLSGHLVRHLPADGVVLEAGCGLGQYVLYLRRRGFATIGADFSFPALAAHRQHHRESPLTALDLRQLPLADGAIAAYISLGVVEHLESGPLPFLGEAARVLRPGGLALVAVPWVNGLRRLLTGRVTKRQGARRDAGMPFYQYCFSRAEIRAFLATAGLRWVTSYPYSPAKGLREFWPGRSRRATDSGPPTTGGPPRRSPLLRQVLYWPPVLAATAHMILAVAVKEASS
jgi:SAM-dependent methyltransferase